MKEGRIMGTLQAAIYARVSSERQAEAQTVASQVAALRERVTADGLALPEAMQFIDEGYSGAVLVRPALERLRDCISAGAVDRLYVHRIGICILPLPCSPRGARERGRRACLGAGR
jgi:DNA invertase Pin-like site-specific DNA recombinase